MTVRVLLNQKGGVGKSTLTVNLAAVTAEATGVNAEGSSTVLAVSVDPQGSASWWADRVQEEGHELPFHIAQEEDPENLRVLTELQGISDVFVDTPGWIGSGNNDPRSRKLFGVLMDSADQLIIPMTTDPLSFVPTMNTIEDIVKPSGNSYVVVINNWDPRNGKAELNEAREMALEAGWPIANTVIRGYRIHARASLTGKVITSYGSNRLALEAKSDFQKLALELATGRW
jgi:chromosome partitioning protein